MLLYAEASLIFTKQHKYNDSNSKDNAGANISRLSITKESVENDAGM